MLAQSLVRKLEFYWSGRYEQAPDFFVNSKEQGVIIRVPGKTITVVTGV